MAEPTQVVELEKPETVAQVVTEEGKDGEKFDAARAQALIDKLRAENKTAKDAEKKLAEFEAAEQKRKDAEKTELEKLQDQLTSAQAKIEASTRREMQRTAAEKYHLPAVLSDRVAGTTAEEMDADAKKLFEAIPKQATLTPTNPGPGGAAVTDAQRHAFIFGGGPLP